MGGRGASSGISHSNKGVGNSYGTQYREIFSAGNLIFVTKVSRQSENLMETMTPGRVYGTIGGKELIRITFFNKQNKRRKVIEKDKRTGKWHVHHGYEHREYSEKMHEPLSEQDQRYLDMAQRLWQNYLRTNG